MWYMHDSVARQAHTASMHAHTTIDFEKLQVKKVTCIYDISSFSPWWTCGASSFSPCINFVVPLAFALMKFVVPLAFALINFVVPLAFPLLNFVVPLAHPYMYIEGTEWIKEQDTCCSSDKVMTIKFVAMHIVSHRNYNRPPLVQSTSFKWWLTSLIANFFIDPSSTWLLESVSALL